MLQGSALSFQADVDDPLRFTRPRTVGAHFGLTPQRWQSGTIDREGGITKQGDKGSEPRSARRLLAICGTSSDGLL
ncbi:MAG: transposase [Roseibium sp.]|uniref:transposase n=1 Tax=Roseibium sp. TaxID=1936156 RepID=UPI00345C3CA1|nr:transposase [Roseibium sp.]